MVITNNHCFLGYCRKLDKEGNGTDINFIETTKIADSGRIEIARQKSGKMSDKKKSEKTLADGYIEQFRYLVDEGLNTYNYYKANTDRNRLRGYIDVDRERENVKPIPFTSKL
jgi:hypothetical protein